MYGAALVDEGRYAIGRRDPAKQTAANKYGDAGIVFEDGWQTVDKVMNPETALSIPASRRCCQR